MPEAEVMLRLAFHLLSSPGADATCFVTPDYQHVESGGKVVFPIVDFLTSEGWRMTESLGRAAWEGTYTKDGRTLHLSAEPSHADVYIRIAGRLIRAECKGGPLLKRPGSPERPIMHRVIGQLMMSKVEETDETLLAAVPRTERFARIVAHCSTSPRFTGTGIGFALVGRDGAVKRCPR